MLNERRLRAYPILIMAGTWCMVLADLLLRTGWRGGSGQILGSDFVTFYAAGLQSRRDVGHLYDLAAQGRVQQALLQPTVWQGTNPFISPPYVAWAYGLFTHLSLVWALILWTLLTFACIVAAVALAYRYLLPPALRGARLSRRQLLIIVLSSLPFVEGLVMGQNHALTLLLAVGVCALSLRGRWMQAGALAGLLIYKPQYALGFLIVWIVWRRYRAIAGFLLSAGAWVCASLPAVGVAPYRAYLATTPQIMALPWVAGYPGYLLATPYGLLATILPRDLNWVAEAGMWLCAAAAGVLLIGVARGRAEDISDHGHVRGTLALAVVYPLLASPFALLHDLLLLIPAFLLWAGETSLARPLRDAAILTYLATLLLLVPAERFGLALMAPLPIGLFLAGLAATAEKAVNGCGGAGRQRIPKAPC
jgi:alpha-1,2-mannosyltransferase